MKKREQHLPQPVIKARAANRLADAVKFAAEKHGRQSRKGTRINYVSHLLHVAALVLEHGGNVDQVMAALLHDVIEDTGVTPGDLQQRFGRRVSAIVQSCTDTLEGDTAGAKSPWVERKERYLAHVKDASREALLVSACDKRHNLGALIDDIRRVGPSYLRRFNSGAACQVWFYTSFAAAVQGRVPRRLATELVELAGEFAQLVDRASGKRTARAGTRRA